MPKAKGIELQPLVNGTNDTTSLLDITSDNYEKRGGTAAGLQGLEEYDMCYPLTLTYKDSEDELLDADEINRRILSLCRGRRPEYHPMDCETIDSLHDIYQLHNVINRAMQRQEFRVAIVKSFVRFLRVIGCEVDVHTSQKHNTQYLQVRMTEESLKRTAQAMNYPLLMDRQAAPYPEYLDDPDFAGPFHVFDPDVETIGRGQGAIKNLGRIWVRYDRLSQPIKAKFFDISSEEVSLFRDVDRTRLLQAEVSKYWNIPQMEKYGYFTTDPFVLHQTPNLNVLREEWTGTDKIFKFSQPVDSIRDYFGEEMALFFAFKSFYTRLLLWPAVLGSGLWFTQQIYDPQLKYDQRWLNFLRLAYCLFLAIWVTWFYQHWMRKQQVLRLRWGIEFSGMRRLPQTRQEFRPTAFKEDPIVPGKWMATTGKRGLRTRQLITATITLFCTLAAVLLVNDDLNTGLRQLLGIKRPLGLMSGFEYVVYALFVGKTAKVIHRAGTLFLTICIKLMDKMWSKKCAYPLTDFENIQTLEKYTDSVSTKLFVFKFFDHFGFLVYLAFFKEFVKPCPDMPDGRCLNELRSTLTILVGAGIVDSFADLLKPLARIIWKRIKVCDISLHIIPRGTESRAKLLKRQFYREKYSGEKGIMNDWQDLMIQFGLLSLFSVVMPLLPLVAMMFNLIDSRCDAFRIMYLYRRPFPRPAASIGFWQTVVQFMGYLAVVSNIVLGVFVAFGREKSTKFKLWLCLALMVVALIVRECVQYAMPANSRRAKDLRAMLHLTMYSAIWGDNDDVQQRRKMMKKDKKKPPVVFGVPGGFTPLGSSPSKPNEWTITDIYRF